MSLGEIMSQHYRDPDTAARIQALGKSKVNPDVDKAMRGEKGKREYCPDCEKEVPSPHKHDDRRAREMDQGRLWAFH